MKATIRNKLTAGFCGVLALMALVAAIAGYAVFSLRRDANDATRVGARLNSLALEIQVHDLEASGRINNFLAQSAAPAAGKKRRMYLEEATFEINEIQSLASKAMQIAPTQQARAKFSKITEASAQFGQAIEKLVQETNNSSSSASAQEAKAAYEDAAEELHESAEDGEVVGHDASQTSLEAIDRTSSRSVALVVGISILGLLLGITVSYKLGRAILDPVEHLKEVAENVSLGNLDIAVRRYSDDEIGDLADSFARMVTAVKFFRMEAQLNESAADVHEVKP